MLQKQKRGLTLHSDMPQDVKDIILEKQLEMKKDCKCIVSQETAIYKIIRDSKKLNNK